MSSSLRKEPPALARAVSNRRRLRTNAAPPVSSTGSLSSQPSSTAANDSLSSQPSSTAANGARSINVEHSSSRRPLPLITPTSVSTTTTSTMIRSSDTADRSYTTPGFSEARFHAEESINSTATSESKHDPIRQDFGTRRFNTITSSGGGGQPQRPKSSPPSQQLQQRMVAKDPPAVHSTGTSRSAEKSKAATPTNRFTNSSTLIKTTTTAAVAASRQSVGAAKTTKTTTAPSARPVVQKSQVSSATTTPGAPNARRPGLATATNNVKSQSKSAGASVMNGIATSSTAKPMPNKALTIAATDKTVNGNHHGQELQQQQHAHLTEPDLNESILQDELDRNNDAYTNFVDDSEDEVLDVEPLQGKEFVDASCLTSGSWISIRCSGSLGLYLSIDYHDNDGNNDGEASCGVSANLQGMGLGNDTDVFQIEAFAPATNHSSNSSSNHNTGTGPGDDSSNHQLLYHGDVVTLSSPGARGRALGVRILKQLGDGKTLLDSTSNDSRYQVGCFDPSEGLGQQWTVLAACHRQRPLWVGPAALTPRVRPGDKAAMIRAGDSIVLRHCDTGGLLSLAIHGETNIGDGGKPSFLTLVTDSYSTNDHLHRQPHQNGSSHSTEESLLSRLQRHDRMFPTAHETFQFIPSTSPPCPRWARHGLVFHSGSYLLMPERIDGSDGAIYHASTNSDSSVPQQENLLLDEVIGSLIGLEGRHVRIHNPGTLKSTENMEFRLVDSQEFTFHLSLRQLVERILPLASAFVQVHAFVVRHSTEAVYGNVMQALCEAVDGPLQEHVSSVNAKLDQRFRRGLIHGQTETATPTLLTMKQLFTVVQPALQTMLVLQAVCCRVRDKKGGSLLNEISRLRNQSFAGDFSAQRLIDELLDKASVPYMEQLRSWLQTGMLDDPYNEFLVQRVDGDEDMEQSPLEPGYNGDTWNRMYMIQSDHVLIMDFTSSDSILQKILRTGKYWNAVGAAGRLDETSSKQDGILELSFRMDSITFLSFVDSMHQSASQALIRLVRNEYNLFETLRTLKRYFLLDQGDFFVNFLDTAEEELSKRATQVSMGQIQHWLNMTIQLCETTGDRVLQVPSSRLDKPVASPLTPHLLKCKLASESLSEHLKSLHGQSSRRDSLDSLLNQQAYGTGGRGLTGVEAFMLAFPRIPFPTSLVISPKAIAAYQLLFRHLFIAKHIERRLVSVWRDQQVMKVLQSLQGALGPSNFLRQRMLHFCQNLIYYMMFEVIEPNWLEMGQAIFGAQGEQTVDSIIDCHNEFLRRTLDACLLTNYEFVRILTKLMTSCLRFADQMKHFVAVTGVHEDGKKIANEKRASAARNINAPPATKKAIHAALVSAKEGRQRLLQEQTTRVLKEVTDETFRKSVARLEHSFSKNLSDFMQLLRSDMGDLYHSHRLNLLIRLDYNGYVTKSIDINSN